jgi:hypothetical protein
LCIVVIAIATNSLSGQTWKNLNDSAVVYRKQDGFDKALDFFMQAKKVIANRFCSFRNSFLK